MIDAHNATMDHQDWKQVILRKNTAPVRTEHKQGYKKRENLDSDNPIAPKTLGLNAGKQIQQARVAKKLTQKQLAQNLNVKPALIQSYEQGKIVPDRFILNKITRVLGIKIKLKK